MGKKTLVVAAVLLWSSRALADQPDYCVTLSVSYNCSRAQTTAGPSLHWPSKNATFRINTASIPTDLSVDTVTQVVRTSFSTWEAVPDAQYEFDYGGATSQNSIGFDFRTIGEYNDNENIVIFQGTWSHDDGIIGLTTATFNAQTGEIFDADIELNAQDYTFTTDDIIVTTDVQNTVTHEAGHFIGFDHTDKDGSTIPSDCASSATMSRRALPGETSKRTLAPTDALGMAFVYPEGGDTQYCGSDETPVTDNASPPLITQDGSSLGGCSAASAPTASAVLLALFLARRRRLWVMLAGLLVPLSAHALPMSCPSGTPQPASCIDNPEPFMCSHAGPNDTGASLHWDAKASTFKVNSSAFPAGLDSASTLAAIQKSFATWQGVSGADITLTYAGDTSSRTIGTDYLNPDQNENIVLFQAVWPHTDSANDSLIIGLTTATFNADTGAIFDADIELNAQQWTFTAVDPSVPCEVKIDVQNTVTHESGHFIGFDHPEKVPNRIPPTCASTMTMSASAGQGETSKRTLSPTDILGAQTVYPVGQPAQYCSLAESAMAPAFPAPTVKEVSSSLTGSCGATSSAGWSAAAALLALGLRRRLRTCRLRT